MGIILVRLFNTKNMGKELVTVEYRLFQPTERQFKDEYPELATMEQFANLSSNEFRLCWAIGSPTSPISNKRFDERCKEAINSVYQDETKIKDNSDLNQVLSCRTLSDLPSKYIDAVKTLSEMNLENRIRAKLATEHTFNLMINLLHIPIETVMTMEVDEKKKHIEMITKINTEMPKTLGLLESGFGIKLVNKKTGKKVLSINDINL